MPEIVARGCGVDVGSEPDYFCRYMKDLVGRGGFEPPTNGLKEELYAVSH